MVEAMVQAVPRYTGYRNSQLREGRGLEAAMQAAPNQSTRCWRCTTSMGEKGYKQEREREARGEPSIEATIAEEIAEIGIGHVQQSSA